MGLWVSAFPNDDHDHNAICATTSSYIFDGRIMFSYHLYLSRMYSWA